MGSVSPTGTITNTYDLQNRLIQVVGPSSNLTFVYDGQGDRLRSYDASSGTPTLSNYAQDLEAGMSDLVSDDSADYAYLDPGSGQAPLAGYTLSTSRTTTLGTDLLGSVRLVTDPTGATIGAGAYDAWGNERPNPDTSTGSGVTLLAGMQGSQPFGFAGQYYDAAAGTYGMRAREYSPTQGQFESVDPLLDQTGQPYEYAGDNPVNHTDPTGQYWKEPAPGSLESKIEMAVDGQIVGSAYQQSGASTSSDVLGLDVGVYTSQAACKQGKPSRVANVVDFATGHVWDIERNLADQIDPHTQQPYGQEVSEGGGPLDSLLYNLSGQVGSHVILPLNGFGFAPLQTATPMRLAGRFSLGSSTSFGQVFGRTTGLVLVDGKYYQWQLGAENAPGLILWQPGSPTDTCATGGMVGGLYCSLVALAKPLDQSINIYTQFAGNEHQFILKRTLAAAAGLFLNGTAGWIVDNAVVLADPHNSGDDKAFAVVNALAAYYGGKLLGAGLRLAVGKVVLPTAAWMNAAGRSVLQNAGRAHILQLGTDGTTSELSQTGQQAMGQALSQLADASERSLQDANLLRGTEYEDATWKDIDSGKLLKIGEISGTSYGALDSSDRPTGVIARLSAPLHPGGAASRDITPPGYVVELVGAVSGGPEGICSEHSLVEAVRQSVISSLYFRTQLIVP